MKILKTIFSLLLTFSGIFLFGQNLEAQTNHVVISEIQISGGPGQTTHDFIELYNPLETIFNLKGYRLVKRTKTSQSDTSIKSWTTDTFIPAHGYYLWASREDESFPSIVGADAATTQTIATDNAVALRQGPENTGQIIDSVGWGEIENNLFETTATVNPEPNQSVERLPGGSQGNGQDTDNNSADFFLQTSPNPQNSSSPPQPPIEPPPPPPESTSTPPLLPPSPPPPLTIQINPGDIVINEFVSDPSDGEEEWLELYNKTSQIISLEGFIIEEGSESQTKLTGNIQPYSFLVIEKPKGNLNNNGDIIFLVYKNLIINQITYGNWDDNTLEDNAPATADPNSVARIKDGADSGNDSLDFKITKTPTKGLANVITEEKPKTEPKLIKEIVINEILPNPAGADTEGEFIELKNLSEKEIDLTDWQISDNTGKRYKIKEIIPTLGFLVLKRSQTQLALNNDTETLTLYNPEGIIAEQIKYTKAPENQSFSRDQNNEWRWTEIITAGAENQFLVINQPPQAVISAPAQALVGEIIQLDGSDSSDPEGSELKFFWEFGDGRTDQRILPTQLYSQIGNYEIKLTVVDNQSVSSTATKIIKILSQLPPSTPEEIYLNEEIKIIISEFLPNPEGSDDSEFIEIYNNSEIAVDLSGWQLDDEKDGSKPFSFPENTVIEPKQYLVFFKTATKISLNNNGDAVRLINDFGEIVDQYNYQEVIEGASYILDENFQWQMTQTPTPGEINVLIKISEESQQATFTKTAVDKITETTLDKIRDFDLGEKIRVKGIVSVEPGILGSQIFYLAGSGIQIYMYKKDFPDLKVGDFIEVIGTLSEAGGERRIKIAQKEDIKILDKKESPQAKTLELSEIDEDKEGDLVTVSGEVIEIKGSSIYLDDGSGEAKIYLKKSTDIEKNFKEGDFITVTGIVSQTQSGYRILPRYQSDIQLTKILGAATEEKPEKEKIDYKEINKYLIVTIVALVIILIGVILKKRRVA